jgi:uncharacterized membrane protein YkvA (DUF1232 family)
VPGSFKGLTQSLRRELNVYRLVLRHPQTPLAARLLVGLAVGYALLPFDLIPDWLPLIGQLDDVILVPALLLAALKLIPVSVIEDCRARAQRASERNGP